MPPAAVRENHAGVVRLLLAAGASLSASASASARYSWTPLHFAAYHGSHDTVCPLVEAGADLNAEDAGGSCPLHLTEYGGLPTAVLLVRLGASTILYNNDGWSALEAAIGSCPIYNVADGALRLAAATQRQCVYCGAGGRYLLRCSSQCRGATYCRCGIEARGMPPTGSSQACAESTPLPLLPGLLQQHVPASGLACAQARLPAARRRRVLKRIWRRGEKNRQ